MDKSTTSRALRIALASFGFSALANGAVISVNLGNNNAANVIASTDTAGVVAVANWNNKLSNTYGSATAVTDDSGTVLTTTVGTVSSQFSGPNAATTTANHVLMGSGTDSSGGDMFANVTGITYDVYDVYVYFGSRGSAGRFGDYTVTPSGAGAAGGGTLRGYDIGTFATVGGFIEETTGDSPGTGNYMVFRNVSGANLLINASPENLSTPRAPLNGFQIVQVPEPSAALLGAVGFLALLRRRR